MKFLPDPKAIAPGVLLAASVTAVALIIGELEETIFDYAVLEPLVLALLLGLLVRNTWALPESTTAGISWSSKQLLEFAIVLLGASLNFRDITDAGLKLLIAITIFVIFALGAGFVIGKLAGLDTRLAILVAVGNAICGNSAIAAVAPAIRATRQQIASAIALTAVFGISIVLALPLLKSITEMTDARYGVLAGLTVYAVPQVLAATVPVSAVSGQFGSVVKLTRVLFLGPVVAVFAWMYREKAEDGTRARLSITKLVPWFVMGFVGLTLLRTAHIVPAELGSFTKDISKILTAIAMAALGLGVDIRSIRSTGGRVFVTVCAITILLMITALSLITLFNIE